MSRRPSRVDKFGINPSVEDVLEWFRSTGYFTEEIVGQSIQKRDLVLFRHTIQPKRSAVTNRDAVPETKAVLFMSLVHGNEPLGLINLLHTAEALLEHRVQNLLSLSLKDNEELNLLFFPVVNVDTYTLNQKISQAEESGGCRRTNMNHTCAKVGTNFTSTCPDITDDGVDLNRNFPFDWESVHEDDCSSNYRGYQPFSEPETCAMRDVVLKHSPIVASMSYHSLHSSDQGLLVHPFASDVPHDYKNKENEMRIMKFGEAMNQKKSRHFRSISSYSDEEHYPYVYRVGNAENTVHYSARGTALDWLYTKGNVSTPFVHESGTPCNRRWCDPTYEQMVKDNARVYAQAGVTLVELVLDARHPRTHFLSAFLASILLIMAVWMTTRENHPILKTLRRCINVSSRRAVRRQRSDAEHGNYSRDVEMKSFLR